MRKRFVVAAAAAVAAAGLAVLALHSRRVARRWRRAESVVLQLREGCTAPTERLWRVADDMAAEMRAGLEFDGGSSLRMIAYPDVALPTGDEEGLYYGVELGRTKVRMSCAQLGGKASGLITKEIAEVPLPSNLMVGTSEELYSYIAAELVKFISLQNKRYYVQDGRPNEVGFTFPFPVQISASQGTLVEWAKGFAIKETAGGDATAGMKKAMEKHGLNMDISLLVTDSIGTLAGGRYCTSNTLVAVIMGTGTNAAYVEPTDAVPKWQGPPSKLGEMVINMEWENFKSLHLPVTEFDVHLDVESPNSGEQIYGKLISGMYLGDIVRRVLLKVAEETVLFGCEIPPKLKIPFILRTPDVASMHQDISTDLEVIGDKMEKSLGIPNTSLRMRELVLEICDIVAKRGARLAGAGIVGILKKIGKDGKDTKAVVVVRGGLYEHYRLFRHYLHSAVKEMLQGKLSDNVVVGPMNDGYGIGAALLSASNSRHVRNF